MQDRCANIWLRFISSRGEGGHDTKEIQLIASYEYRLMHGHADAGGHLLHAIALNETLYKLLEHPAA